MPVTIPDEVLDSIAAALTAAPETCGGERVGDVAR
jgi:hypothetical protein